MNFRKVDQVIIGHGLAGACLAWTLIEAGQRVVVIDQQTSTGSSRIAAGLITPLSGPKLTQTWNWEESLPIARRFYDRLAEKFDVNLLEPAAAIRRATTAEEAQQLSAILHHKSERFQADFQVQSIPNLDSTLFADSPLTLSQPAALRLRVQRFLNASENALQVSDSFRPFSLTHADQVQIFSDRIEIEELNLCCQNLIFCQGAHTQEHPWFGRIQFNPAKGEVLKVKIPGLNEQRIVHQGVWIAHDAEEIYFVGSTFDWQNLDSIPTDSARQDLLKRLNKVLCCPFTVIDHHAAVRPTMRDFRPVIGRHPTHPRLWTLNGLGTKGSLWGPWAASVLKSAMLDNVPVPAELDVQRWFR